MPVSTLEIADATEGINLQEWFDLLVLTPNVRELFIKQPIEGPGRVVSNIVTALASFSGQAVESPVKCPHLKDVKVRGTVYSPWLIDVIGQSAKWRAQYRAPLRSLELVLAPRFNGMPHCEFASDAARDWAAKLQVDKYVGRVVVKDAIIRSF
ncbi:hypothetical protein L226DRAFT_530702 [Lentinus tigrinus ALCF2SS1-7]|nr:hypothetical protein L226DRAFT_530702 [Lentinus tigrinus ALCF2SS1-7]